MVSKFRKYGYLALWLLFLACFAATGLHGFIISQHSPRPLGNGPYCSSDGLLVEFLGIKEGSQKILDAFLTVPPKDPEVVFWPAQDNNTSMSWQVISYLGWPRKIEGMAVKKEQLDALARIRVERDIWLFGFAPPADVNHWKVVARGLAFIPAEQPEPQ